MTLASTIELRDMILPTDIGTYGPAHAAHPPHSRATEGSERKSSPPGG